MDAPPSYEEVTGKRSTTHRRISGSSQRSSRNDIPVSQRRSMEDEARPLPRGWIRQYDPTEEHQFFVDTTANPPRAIWQHPYDDEAYLSTLDPAEREAVSGLLKPPARSNADIEAEYTDEDDFDEHGFNDTKGGPMSPGARDAYASSSSAAAGPSSARLAPPGGRGKQSLGRKMKDKLTGSTHQEREAKRRQRAEEERRIYEQHRRVREAMSRAMQTGQPQLVGKDASGKDVYIEPPTPGPMGYGGYPGNAYGYNPYQRGPYSNPNARYIRPQQPYGRPYGYGYGGGYGGFGGLGLPIAGGLAGGLLLGGLMGGF